MGYMAHHTIVVTSWSKEHIKTAHDEAVKIFEEKCSSILGPFVNDQSSFFIAPDGSKEGWTASDEGDEKREDFIKWLEDARTKEIWLDYVEVRFGGDDPELAIITNHNGEE